VLGDRGVLDFVAGDAVQQAAGLFGALGRVLRQIARAAAALLIKVWYPFGKTARKQHDQHEQLGAVHYSLQRTAAGPRRLAGGMAVRLLRRRSEVYAGNNPLEPRVA
jgi:hypothetical protein